MSTKYETLVGIITKYHPGTSRISARRFDHTQGEDKITYYKTYGDNHNTQAHARAALHFIERNGLDWGICPVGVENNDFHIWTTYNKTNEEK